MTRLARLAVHLAVGAAVTLAAAAASLTVHDTAAKRVLWVAGAVIVAAGGGVGVGGTGRRARPARQNEPSPPAEGAVMRADDVLDQLDTCLGDYDIGPDAMRSAPDLPPPPGPSCRRVVIRMRIDDTAVQARLREAQESIRAMAEAMRPAVEGAGRSIARAAESMRTYCDAHQRPLRPAGRPAWQSPYGPPARRR